MRRLAAPVETAVMPERRREEAVDAAVGWRERAEASCWAWTEAGEVSIIGVGGKAKGASAGRSKRPSAVSERLLTVG